MTKGKDLAAFRAAHDKSFIVPQKVRAGLAKLGDSWAYEVDFIKLCELSTTDLATYRDQFTDFFVEVRAGKQGKRVWAGTKAFASKMRAVTA
jgi:hypothetical protein